MSNDITREEFLNQLVGKLRGGSQSNIAVLWDVENVTPGKDSFFVDGLLEYLQQFGRITVAKAYGNWSNRAIRAIQGIAQELSKNHFQLIYTPKARKNSSDMIMITDGMEVALKHDYIDLYVLITGDSDFRPFISSLRRNGKKINIVCDMKIASEDLLILADDFIDYRELLPGGDDEPDEQETSPPSTTKQGRKEHLEEWFNRLVEVIEALEAENKQTSLGVTKIKLKMLNPEFDEKNLGFNKWSKFVNAAIERNYVVFDEKDGDTLKVKTKRKRQSLPFIPALKETLASMGGKTTWLDFSQVGKELRDRGVTPKKYGFKQFKQLFHAAENRNEVITKAEGFRHLVKLP